MVGDRDSALALDVDRARRRSAAWWANALRFCRRKPLGAIGAALVILLILVAAFAPVIAPFEADESIPGAFLRAPSWQYLTGTDNLARDTFSRIVLGSRISLTVGFLSVLLGVSSGAAIGIITSYWGGKWDMIAQRFMDILWAFPTLIIAIVIISVLGSTLQNVVIAVAIILVPTAARVARSVVLVTKESEYVMAAKAIGAGTLRIVVRHVAPSTMAALIIVATAGLGSAIITEASLSFLGMGVPPPHPSWGRMLFGASRKWAETAPWLPIFPGVAISLSVFGFNLLGDALRDVLDPRLRGSQ